MTKEQFEKGLGVDIETFIKIITEGFYYISKKYNAVYWCNNAIFIGNGFCPHSNNMIRTHFLDDEIDPKTDKVLKDQHYWDWAKEEDVFCFRDYGKTWSINRDDLERKFKEKNNGCRLCKGVVNRPKP